MVANFRGAVRPLWPRLLGAALLVGAWGTTSGCGWMPPSAAQPGPRGQNSEDQPVAVETQIVGLGAVDDDLAYTGTTRAAERVTVRAQVEGQVVNLGLDVGDPVAAGQILAQLEPTLLTAGVDQTQAELEARQSEVIQAQSEVSDAETAVAEAQLRVQQAQIESDRWQRLAAAGAASAQEAEQAQLVLDTAQQVLRSTQERVRNRQQAVRAAQGRVSSQRAVLAQSQERLSLTAVRSPLAGVILSRTLTAGDFAPAGTEILQIGDLSTLKITVEVSELDLGSVSRGQPVAVTLDAFPDVTATGRVTRISPVADETSRLIPVEVTLENPGGRIGTGLLARLQFLGQGQDQVLVPPEAVRGEPPTLFVVAGEGGDEPTVIARTVTLGEERNGKVAVLSGLNPGEKVVVRSDRPLEDGQAVRLSILSE